MKEVKTEITFRAVGRFPIVAKIYDPVTGWSQSEIFSTNTGVRFWLFGARMRARRFRRIHRRYGAS